MPLTDASCRNAKPRASDYKLSDSGGLYLLVTTNGSRLWKMKYRLAGREKKLSFGAYPVVGLADARDKQTEAKRRLTRGEDPASPIPETAVVDPFQQIGEEWLVAKAGSWVPAYAARVEARLRDDVFPTLGPMAIRDIKPKDALSVFRKIEERGAIESAKRIKQYVSQIFAFAIASDRADSDPTARLSAALLPSPPVKHQIKIPESELPRFMARLRAYDGEEVTRLAIELVLRTWTRTGEVRFAKWSEIDGDLWRIPAARMKMTRDHLVPLTPQVLELLDRLKVAGKGSPLIAPGQNGPMSENTMLYAVYRMGFAGRGTIHGLRGTASTICNESGLFHKDWVERQLAHVPEDQVRSAYNAAEYLGPRRAMMTFWNDLLDVKADLGELLG